MFFYCLFKNLKITRPLYNDNINTVIKFQIKLDIISSLSITKQQDLIKQMYVDKLIKSWSQISVALNQKFQGIRRTPKQCRERFMNFIRFNNMPRPNTEWTLQEIAKLSHSFLVSGPKWSKIAQQFQQRQASLIQRSENQIKNKFYGLVGKLLRRINLLAKYSGVKRQLTQKSLIKLLQFSIVNEYKEEFIKELKSQILGYLFDHERSLSMDIDKALQIVKSYNEFNKITRRQVLKKIKRDKKKESRSIGQDTRKQEISLIMQRDEKRLDDPQQNLLEINIEKWHESKSNERQNIIQEIQMYEQEKLKVKEQQFEVQLSRILVFDNQSI